MDEHIEKGRQESEGDFMRLVENITNEELNRIKKEIGAAFVSNELFHEFGTLEERESDVMKYMACYVQYVYDTKSLYQNEDGTAYIGACYSKEEKFWPQLKLMCSIIKDVPFKKLKKMLGQVKENASGNQIYTRYPYIEILMVCVTKDAQGKGMARELVDFAKEMAKTHQCPLLFDTDMKAYAQMYQHLGCELYSECTASNGVTRYSLVYHWQKNT